MKTNSFCRFLSNGCSINLSDNNFVVRPCCWFDGSTTLDDITKFNSIETWTSHCDVCYKQELAGLHSFRKASFDIVPEDSQGITALDVNIDFNCNAACVICGPESSSLWSKQINKHSTIYIQPNTEYQSKLDYILKNIDMSNLKRIKFFGGEPFMTDSHMQVLSAVPNPKNVSIWYTTNASILPDHKVYEMWSKFHLVFFEASIDGTKEQFEYIRWPLKWNTVTKNLVELKKSGPVNLLFRINHTLNPFNIYYYDRLDEWFVENLSTNRLGDISEINLHPCWGTWGLDKTPNSLRDEVRTKYNNHKIVAILNQTSLSDTQPILDFTNKWDPIRKNNWRSTFPEIIKYF
jgi:sulfatase maturation enzyme AslB (radical SAM superfamily)